MSSLRFSRRFEARWADLDANGHLRHTAYADYATHVRFSFLVANGFPARRFAELGFGPVLFREETRFLKEVGPQEALEIDLRAAALSPDGTRWKLVHTARRADGAVAAVVTVEGAWLDLVSRKLTPPPPELAALLGRLERTAGFAPLAPGSEAARRAR